MGSSRLAKVVCAAAVVLAAGALCVPVQAAPPPTDGWVLGLGFESTAGGQVQDRSPSTLAGVLRGDALPVLKAGKAGHGKAIELDSRHQQFVDVPDAPKLDVNTYTLTAWVRLVPRVHDDRWEVMEKAGAYWMNIRTDSRRLRVGGFYGGCDGQVGNTWRYFDSVRTIPVRTWIHVASTYDGHRLRIYINGALDSSLAVTGRTCSNAEPLAIGAKNKTSAGLIEAYFDGRIDDVRVYSKALSAKQISAVRSASVG